MDRRMRPAEWRDPNGWSIHGPKVGAVVFHLHPVLPDIKRRNDGVVANFAAGRDGKRIARKTLSQSKAFCCFTRCHVYSTGNQ